METLTCQHCMGTGQPNGAKGGPELGLCGFCGGTGSVWSLTGEHPLAATVESLRSELEAVKREAVEVLKPFAAAAANFDSFPVKDPTEWFAYGGVMDVDGHHGAITAKDLNDARAFVEKHGRDGNG
jgi:hypothetical protein